MAMALLLPAQPLLAAHPAPQPSVRAADAIVVSSVVPVTASLATDLPAALVPLTALAIGEQRQIIAQQLESLGRAADTARNMADELTAEDLAVLLANPKMMQKAGEIDVIVWAIIVVGVVVALVIAAEGTVIVNA
jgi:hypothetical protein